MVSLMSGRRTFTATSSPGDQPRAVDLRDGGRGDRLGIEPREELLEGSAKLGLDRPLGDTGLERRHLVLQPGELPHELLAEQVGPQAEPLTELDEGRTQFLEGEAQPLGLTESRLGDRDAPPERQAAARREPRWKVQPAQHVREPVAREHAHDFAEPAELPRRRPEPDAHPVTRSSQAAVGGGETRRSSSATLAASAS